MADIVQLDDWRRRRDAAARPADPLTLLAESHRLLLDAVARQRAITAELLEHCQALESGALPGFHASLVACTPLLDTLRQHGRDGRDVVRTIETGDIEACIALRDRLLAGAAR